MVNINLLPPQLKLYRLEAKKNASLISICIVFIIIFATLGIIARSFQSTIKMNLDNAKNDLQQSGTLLAEYQTIEDLALLINDRAKSADDIGKSQAKWSQVLTDLANRVPADVQIESLSTNLSKSPNFVLIGNTTTEREIIKFKDKLEDSVFFKSVAFKSSSMETGSDQATSRLKFTLEFEIEQKSIN